MFFWSSSCIFSENPCAKMQKTQKSKKSIRIYSENCSNSAETICFIMFFVFSIWKRSFQFMLVFWHRNLRFARGFIYKSQLFRGSILGSFLSSRRGIIFRKRYKTNWFLTIMCCDRPSLTWDTLQFCDTKNVKFDRFYSGFLIFARRFLIASNPENAIKPIGF